jgi:Na+-driven multidrug efflux pump
MEGAGDTFPIMLATLLSMWLIQAPLGYFLTQVTGIGVYGVQWAITGALLGRGTFFAIYFRLGRWKRKKI